MRPGFDNLSKKEIGQLGDFIRRRLQETFKRCMPEEMHEMKDKDRIEVRK